MFIETQIETPSNLGKKYFLMDQNEIYTIKIPKLNFKKNIKKK